MVCYCVIISGGECGRVWPQLELLLPIALHGARVDEWKDVFLRSLFMFWPLQASGTRLQLLLDAEDRNKTAAVSIVRSLPRLRSETSLNITASFNEPSRYYEGFR